MSGGRRAANGSVISSACPANANSSAGRPPARPESRRPPVGTSAPRRIEHALEVRRRDVVAERRRVDVAELVEREGRRREREADVRVRQLAAQPVARRVDDRAVVERGRGKVVDRCQLVSAGHRGVDAERDEAEVGGRDLPLDRVPARVAVGRHLLQVRDLGEVDLRREVAADRRLEGLVRREHAAGERPGAGERLERPLPEQCLQDAVPHLEHGGEGDLGGLVGAWRCVGLVDFGRGLRLIVKN